MLMMKQDERMGAGNSDLHTRMQIEMIGNVFYNMLNSIGVRERDERMVNLSSQVKEMLQTRSFDNIVGQKVPHLKNGVLNLLKVVDLPMEDRAELMRLGFGDILMNPSVKPN